MVRVKVRELSRVGLNLAQKGLTRRLPFIEKQEAARLGLLPEVVHPVVVVPGVLGTWPPAFAPHGRLDPITKVYTNLLDGLRRIGYVPGVSLFAFPYDWRRNVAELTGQLAAEIQRIRQLPPTAALKRSSVKVDYSRVDLVCHSMGGLIARNYVQSEAYAQDVARMMLVAVPQRGSIAAYYAYEGGDSTMIGLPVEAARLMAAILETREAKIWQHKARRIYWNIRGQNLPDVYNYTRQHFRSIQDLLPSGAQNYLYRLAEDGQELVYPFGPEPGYPANPLVENLNRLEHLSQLDRVDEIYNVYSGSQPTLVRVQVEASPRHPVYQYGEPVVPQPLTNTGPGDGIVPVISARLQLPDLRPDGQPWQLKLHQEDLARTLGRGLNHVEIVADPVPVRYLLDYFIRPGLPQLDAAIWDGPPLAARRPNYAALFI